MYPSITKTDHSQSIITWQDHRSGSQYDIYAQKLDASGVAAWTADGVGVRNASIGDAEYPCITADGAGGAIIAWQDYRSASHYDIYVQQVDSGGINKWTADGLGICTVSTGDAKYPCITTDGGGGAIIAWQDYRSGSQYDIYAQRTDFKGNVMWTTDGEAVRSSFKDNATSPCITTGGSGGGAIIAWQDFRSTSKWDVYAQRLDADGKIFWTEGGEGIRTASASDATYPCITSDGSEGAIIAWQDYRSGTYWGIYAQRAVTYPAPTVTEITPLSGTATGVVKGGHRLPHRGHR